MDGQVIDRKQLARVIPIWPHETDAELIETMRKTLIAWRQRGLANHWTYDKARHSNLLALYERWALPDTHDDWRAINER